jgi:hypothetical protein
MLDVLQYRVLRALAGVGIFTEDSQGRFALTPLADLLRSDMAHSQRSIAIMMGSEFYAAFIPTNSEVSIIEGVRPS